MYFPDLLAPLLRCLIQLTSPPLVEASIPAVTVIISYKIRSLAKETQFWSAFGLWFNFEPVLCRSALDSDSPWLPFKTDPDEDMWVFVARRRSESLLWKVPLDDTKLLAGYGSLNTFSAKEDDTFEILLLNTLCSTTI